MQTIPDLISNLFQGIAAYQDVFSAIAIVVGLLLLAAGVQLVRGAQAQHKPSRKLAYGLLVGTSLLALAIGVPFFIPYPHADFLVPGVPLYPIYLILGLFAGLAYFRMKSSQALPAVLFAVGALVLVPVVYSGTSSLLGMGYSPNLIWASYFIPPLSAGILLAWTTTAERWKFYSLYVLAWLLVADLVVLPSYIGEMYNYQANLDSALSAQHYLNAPEAGPMIDRLLRGEAFTSAIYLIATLLLLFLPLASVNLYGTRLPTYATSD